MGPSYGPLFVVVPVHCSYYWMMAKVNLVISSVCHRQTLLKLTWTKCFEALHQLDNFLNFLKCLTDWNPGGYISHKKVQGFESV
jgi:hypothetical protein